MKEQDFDEIGKRLYDLEAAPPDKGWKRIAGTLNTLRGVSWLRKNWWKSFVLIIPALLYFGYNELNRTDPTVSLNADVMKFDEKAGAGREPHITTPMNDQLQDAESIKSRVSASSEQAKNSEGSRSIHASAGDALNINQTHPSQKIISNKTEVNNIPYVSTPLITNNSTDGNAADSKPLTTDQITSNGEVSSHKGAAIENIPTNERLLESHAGVGAAAITTQPVTNDDKAKLNATSETDSIFMKSDSDKSAEVSSPTWRINVSIMPQYINRTIQPLATDDVFVTKVEGKNSPNRTGVEIGIGVARSLSSNLYLDARLSYNNFKQEFTYSYSDGNVDTLIRVKQPDESVRVTPVYHVTNREIKSDYHYASLSLGTTYYFWSRAKSRFNLSASADMHYLLSAQIKEKVNDQWVTLGDNTTNKTNYSFTIGAGYNITLYKGLELMIRPSLRYFTSVIKSAELPYKLNQRSVGINFMLSKTIGKD